MVSDGSRKGRSQMVGTDGRRKARIHSIVATYILARTIEIDKTIRTIRRRSVSVKTIRTIRD
jgi:hypothetical protein